MNLGESVENSIKRTSEYLTSLGANVMQAPATAVGMEKFMPSSGRATRSVTFSPLPPVSPQLEAPKSAASWSLASMTWKGWALIIFILAILGVNIFAILGRGTAEVADIFGPIIKKVTALFVGTTGQIVGTSAAGAKAVVGVAADVTDKALTTVQDVATPHPDGGSGSGGDAPPNPAKRPPPGPPPMPHGGTGEMPPEHGAHGPGFCYVGSDDAFRSCVKVGYDDLCMSGEIFPTHELCVNPSLRA